jgi:hypothetical protein
MVVHQIVEINRLLISVVFSTISFKSLSTSSDTGDRPNNLPLLIVPILKNLFTMLFRYFDGIHFYKQIIPHY